MTDPTRCYWTFAPAAYDYWYVTELATVENNGRTWRLVTESDEHRFVNYQTPRYHSGNSPVIPLADAAQHGLPTSLDDITKGELMDKTTTKPDIAIVDDNPRWSE